MITHARQSVGAVDDVHEAAVDDVATVVQRRMKHDLGLVDGHRDEHHWRLDVLQLVELARLVAERIAFLQRTHTRAGTN